MSTRKHLLSKRGFEVPFKTGARKAGCNLVHSGEVGQGAMLRGFRVSRCQHRYLGRIGQLTYADVERLSSRQVSAHGQRADASIDASCGEAFGRVPATSCVISKSRNSDAPSSQALQRAGGEQGMAMLASVLADALRAAHAPGDGRHDTLSIADLSLKLVLTEKEAAAYAGLSLADIERARASVKAIKTGAGWRVKREELEHYVKKL